MVPQTLVPGRHFGMQPTTMTTTLPTVHMSGSQRLQAPGVPTYRNVVPNMVYMFCNLPCPNSSLCNFCSVRL